MNGSSRPNRKTRRRADAILTTYRAGPRIDRAAALKYARVVQGIYNDNTASVSRAAGTAPDGKPAAERICVRRMVFGRRGL